MSEIDLSPLQARLAEFAPREGLRSYPPYNLLRRFTVTCLSQLQARWGAFWAYLLPMYMA